MPKYDKIDALITDLNRYKKLLSALFDGRMSTVQEETVLDLMEGDTEKLERLAAYGLLVRAKGQVSLESRVQSFFEEYLEVDETVHVLYIQEHLDKIKELKSYYLKETHAVRKEPYLLRIKKHLRSIIRVTLLNVKTLRNNTDETYKAESNFEVKKEKLSNIRLQRDQLEGVIKAVERLLEDELFFRTAVDDELLMLVHQLKVTLHESYHNLIEIQRQVITYLNQIEKRVQVVEKVLRLKLLRDKHYLKQQTNFYELAGQLNDLPVTNGEAFRSRLSVTDLRNEEEMQQLVLKVRERLRNQKALALNVAGEMPEAALDDDHREESSVDLSALRTIFRGKNQDLFTFVMHHQFKEEVSDRERIRYYCRMASLFESEFQFTDQTAVHQQLEYALIYPQSKPLK